MNAETEKPKRKKFIDCETRIIPFSDLIQEDFRISEPTLYEIHWNGVKFEFLLSRKPNSNQAAVFGTGDVGSSKTKYQFPIFSRGRWANDLLCNGIWYFDPTVYLGEATIGWYYGTNQRWYLKDIAEIIRHILQKWNITMENTVFSGSSGGGFSSILLASMLKGKAAAMNPQFNAANFHAHAVDRLKKAVLNPGEELLDERMNTVSLIRQTNYFPQIYVKQNLKASKDLETQLLPFLNEIQQLQFDCKERVHIEFYNAEGGHNAMPTQEETLNWIYHILEQPLLDMPVVKTAGYFINNEKLYFYLDTGTNIRLTKEEKIDFSKLSGYRFHFQLLNDKKAVSGSDVIDTATWRTFPVCAFHIPDDGTYIIKYTIDDGTHRERYFARDIKVTNHAAQFPVTGNMLEFIQDLQLQLKETDTDKTESCQMLSRSIQVAQNGNMFTFSLDTPVPDAQYSWGIYNAQKILRFGSSISSNPQFTYCARMNESVYVGIIITDSVSGEKHAQIIAGIREDNGVFTLDPGYRNQLLDASAVTLPATPLKLRYRSSEISYSAKDHLFTFFNECIESETEYSFSVLNQENQVLESTPYTQRNYASFAMNQYSGNIKIKAAAKYRGMQTSRIAAEVFCDPEKNIYKIDPAYKNPYKE